MTVTRAHLILFFFSALARSMSVKKSVGGKASDASAAVLPVRNENEK